MAQENDFDECIQVTSVEELLSSPICWKCRKTCDFFANAHKFIKDKEGDPTITDFISKLDSDAISSNWMLWYPHENWENVLGQEHFDLVTIIYHQTIRKKDDTGPIIQVKTGKVKVEDNASAVELLRLIRNRCEHNELFKDGEKEKLNWFRKIKGEWQFDESLYTTYWNIKFPRLELCLWFHFYKFRNYPTLRQFYCHDKLQSCENLLMLPSQLYKALQWQVNEGALDARYSLGECCSLEFRSDANNTLHSLLDGSTAMEIIISSYKVTCRWYESRNINDKKFKGKNFRKRKLVDTKVTHLSSEKNENSNMFEAAIILGSKINELDSHFIREKMSNSRIILFARNEYQDVYAASENLIRKISGENKIDALELPVIWSELRKSVKDSVATISRCVLQDKEVALKDLLPNDNRSKLALLSELKGTFLNNILRNLAPVILGKLELPSISEIYIERQLYNCDIISPVIFQKCSQKDLFFACDVPHEILKVALRAKPGYIAVIDNNTDFVKINLKNVKARVFLVKSQMMEYYGAAVYKFSLDPSKTSGDTRIHCLRFVNSNSFNWMRTHGTFSNVEALFTKAAMARGSISEKLLLDSLTVPENRQRIIFIGDTPGMGKSQVLISIAGKLSQKFNDRFVLFFTMSEFMHNLKVKTGKRKIAKSDIIGTIIDSSCSNDFECKLIEYWLLLDNSVGVKFEIMMDGLDEVEFGLRKYAFEVLEIIRDEIPTVYIWVTLRNHLLNDVRVRFGCLGYRLLPFSKRCQKNFLVSYWLETWKKKGSSDNIPSSKQKKLLHYLAKKCFVSVQLGLAELAGIPLQCRMIAEIYEWIARQVLSNYSKIFKQSIHSINGLYQRMFLNKLEIYLKEKNNLVLKINHPIVSSFIDNMERVHIYFAIKLVFSEDAANMFRKNLLIPKKPNSQFDSAILELGLVQKLYPLSFIHRTFAEFIVAWFVYRVLTDDCLYVFQSDTSFQNFLWNEVLSATYEGDFEETGYIYLHTYSEFKYPALCRFLNDRWTENIKPRLFDRSFRNILRREFDCTAEFVEEATLFATASRLGYENIFSLLENSETHMLQLFITALECQRYEVCKYLIESKEQFSPSNWYRVQESNKNGYSVLHWTIKGLLQYDINIFPEDFDGEGVLEVESEEVIRIKGFLKFILENDKSILELKDAEGKTPLLLLLKLGIISYYNVCPVLEMFILILIRFFVNDLRANVNATDNEGNTVLHIPYECGDDSDERSEFFQAGLRFQYYIILDFFMENGCDKNVINSFNLDGNSPLLQAIFILGDYACPELQIFQKFEADFNAKDKQGNTALHIAIERNFYWKSIRELIVCGADIYLVNGKGKTALDLAVQMENKVVENMLVNEFHAKVS